MSPASITLLIFACAVALFVSDVLPMGLVVFAVPLSLYFCGIITAQEIFAPMVGPSIVLVVAMCVVGAALFKTGMAAKLGETLFRFCPGERSLVFAVVLFGGFLSGFVSNTGTVAVLLPIVMGAAAVKGIVPSRLLIPLAYGATLGGNLSVIGSPGNLIAKETIERFSEGAMSVGFFEYARAGLPLLLVCAAFLALFGRRFVPERPSEAARKYAPKDGTRLDWRSWFTVAVLVLTVVGMVLSDRISALPPMHVIACVGAASLVLFRVLTQKEAFASFDLQAVFLLSFMTPLGNALVKTGAADRMATLVVDLVGGSAPLVVTAVLWLVTWALTQVMSNTAACALFCPVAWSVATALGADPRAAVISVLIASSVGVCTPLAIPANMLILEPGNLRFRDFFRSGLAVSAVAFSVSLVVLPLTYPFFPK